MRVLGFDVGDLRQPQEPYTYISGFGLIISHTVNCTDSYGNVRTVVYKDGITTHDDIQSIFDNTLANGEIKSYVIE